MHVTRSIMLLGLLVWLLWAMPAPAAELVLVAGEGSQTQAAPALESKLLTPFGVAFTPDDELVFVELKGERVAKIDRQGRLSTIAGNGETGDAGDGGPAAAARFNGLHSLAIGPSGDVYLADTWNHRVRKIDARTGTISTVAGTGTKGYSGDGGPALEADCGGIYCIAVNADETLLYLADLDNRRIRRVDLKSGIIDTVAGNGEKGVPADGAQARTAPLVDPRAVAVDRHGNVYVLERGGHALRVVSPDGTIRTVAGTGEKGSDGDGGPALSARLNGPKHICIDLDDSVLIADAENHLVRRYRPADGTIVRVAGTGERGSAGVGGDPLRTQLNQPHGVTVHPSGVLYISDSTNHRILRLEP